MKKDTQDALEEFQNILWNEEEEKRSDVAFDDDIDQFLRDFNLMEEVPDVYNTDRNDYDEPLQTFAKTGGDLPKKPRAGKLTLVLAITACCLCLGIVGMLIYWMERFL